MLRKHIERIVRFPVTTILLAVFITVFFAFQISGLHMVLDPKALLPQDHPYVRLNNEIEKQFGGSRVVLIGLASKDGDIFNPSDIEKIRKINEEVKTLPGILENNVVSIADRKVKVVKAEGDSLEINSLLDGIEYTPEGMKKLKDRVNSNPAFINSLISEDGTVAAILLDFKGGDSSWLQKQSKTEELSVVPSAFAQEDWKKWQKPEQKPETSPLAGEGQVSPEPVEGGGGAGFPPGIKIGVAGSIPVMMALNQTMVSGKIWNILQIAGIVFVITSIVLRSLVGGILVLLPLGIAVLTNFGVLGLFGIGLGVGTAAISAMAVGFGADYSIYLLYRLREEVRGEKRELDASVRQTLLTAGKAIIFVALALSAGGLTLLFTGYYLHMEGFLVPLAMTTSSLATLIVLPAIVKVIRPGFICR